MIIPGSSGPVEKPVRLPLSGLPIWKDGVPTFTPLPFE